MCHCRCGKPRRYRDDDDHPVLRCAPNTSCTLNRLTTFCTLATDIPCVTLKLFISYLRSCVLGTPVKQWLSVCDVLSFLHKTCATCQPPSLRVQLQLINSAICRYADMLKDVGTHNQGSSIFLPHSPGNVKDVANEVSRAAMLSTTSSCD